MKYIYLFSVLLLCSSCFYIVEPLFRPGDTGEPVYSQYKPVYMDREDANSKIVVSDPREVESAGKFYIYNQYILLVEKGKGVHVFDNRDISDPKKIAFLEVLNATDMAIRNQVLFLNQSRDLVALDFSNSAQVKVISRIENVSNDITPDGLPLKYEYEMAPANSIVVGWELIDNQ